MAGTGVLPHMGKWIGRIVLLLVVFALGFVAGFKVYGPYSARQAMRRWIDDRDRFLNKPAPEVETSTVDGRTWRLSDQRGKVVILDFWATSCGPCMTLLPDLVEVHDHFSSRDDVIFVGVSLDRDRIEVNRFLLENWFADIQLHEEGRAFDNSVAVAFGITSIPSVVIVNKEGNVISWGVTNTSRIIASIREGLRDGVT